MDLQVREALSRFDSSRQRTEAWCKPLITEDYGVQSMPDVSPPKWHLAHVTWFYEQFLLRTLDPSYTPFNDQYGFLFNSYYEAVGKRVDRAKRGLLSRPSVEEIYAYRAHVNRRVHEAVENASAEDAAKILPILTLGAHHEEQHQELLLMDILHIFWSNPLRPAYFAEPEKTEASSPSRWLEFRGGIRDIGVDDADPNFAFDNERPRHSVLLRDFRLRSELVTDGDILEFIAADGYRRPELWLSDGWATVKEQRWEAPLYWEKQDSRWWQMSLYGMNPVRESRPAAHLSFFEADAYARWRGLRLPTEFEWEDATRQNPAAFPKGPAELWQWTSSAYQAYPGFRPLGGALGEYNEKFMCNQMVLRGGCRATPPGHIRPTYRNFFPPAARWQFSGVRLAS